MQNMLHQQSQQGGLLPTTVTFSAQTTSTATQEMIEAKLERRHRNRQAPYMLPATLPCRQKLHVTLGMTPSLPAV